MRLLVAALIALLPSALKVLVYRFLFGYAIGRNVHIGCSLIIRVRECSIADGVRIGSFNLFTDVADLTIEQAAHIGTRNVIRGGRKVRLGAYSTLLRGNVLNSILEAESINPRDPQIRIGHGSVITSGHWIDFTDSVVIGHNVIIGGRNSSIWTHNRQRTKPVVIGHHSYLGSEIRIAPGAGVGPLTVVAIGSVLTSAIDDPHSLVGGNPAVVVRALKPSEYPLVSRKNRDDIPDSLVYADLPDEFRAAANLTEADVKTNYLVESSVGG